MAHQLNVFSTAEPEQASCAMTALMIMPALLLQKPSPTSKAKDHSMHLTRRIELWQNGRIPDLLKEGQAIQRNISSGASSIHQDAARRGFVRSMVAGNVNKALRCLNGFSSGGVLGLDDDAGTGTKSVLDVLHDKHPEPREAQLHTLLRGPVEIAEPVIFEPIDAAFVRATALQLSGAAGVSGLDAEAWKRACCSFSGASTSLCTAIARTAKILATKHVPAQTMTALLAGRLIPLDKKPGVRPIGIGEVLRRLIAKVVLRIARPAITEATGTIQLCGGQAAGIEAAVHAMKEVFADESTEGLLLVDATNAFNAVNRQAMLHNVKVLCPEVSTLADNFYMHAANLHVAGTTILSQEGTTQGDPLAMPLYALAVMPVISSLAAHESSRQAMQEWYADDAAAAGKIRRLRAWWDRLAAIGPDFGYYPNASKTWLIVKPSSEELAKEAFAGTGVNITTEGRPYLGTPIGSEQYCLQFMDAKVIASCCKSRPAEGV